MEAGLPPGVCNIIHGGRDAVNFICDAPAVKAISFVGSNQAGEYIHARGTANGKRVQVRTNGFAGQLWVGQHGVAGQPWR
jgi:acyl-CoA reductase-like NAD-dependent aldehyde dehydrogenase